jgi:hypothetical protein
MAKKIANKKYGIVLVGRDWKMPFKDIEPVINKVKKEFPEFDMEDKLEDGVTDSVYTALSNYPDIIDLTDEIGSDLFMVDGICDNKGVIWFNSIGELETMVEYAVRSMSK